MNEVIFSGFLGEQRAIVCFMERFKICKKGWDIPSLATNNCKGIKNPE
jgi:hypothetical protein